MVNRETDKQSYRERIGRIVRDARESHNMSVRGLAQQIDMNHSTLSRAERGQTDIDQPTLARIANLLNIDPRELSTESIVSYEDEIDRRLFADTDNVPIKYIFDDINGLHPAGELDVTSIARDWLIEDADIFTLILNSDVINNAILAGYIVAVAPNILPNNGEIILCEINGIQHVRRYYTTQNTTILDSDSRDSKYEPIILTTNNDSYKFEIKGVVVGAISNQTNHP
ncbi:helix-turn-helix domain-containing protein [Enterococcus sp. DIV0170]|uniref:helix-turn-helix domain-containing protein n=1 Tax=Enterococcus sp. DIV0170 TaxID=2774642 RepID=UPI003F25ADAF